ncbi:hypothetical protein D3C71_278330 [compost metagenome]|jgi:hypothetical protein
MNNEIRIPGAKAMRWLRRAPRDRDLLLETGFEDDRHEFLWRITALADDSLDLQCEDSGRRRRIPLAQVAQGAIIVSAGHPLIASVETVVDPAERLLEQAVADLRPHLQGELHSIMDAPLLLEAVHQAAEGRLPADDVRKRQAAALKANEQWRLGARIAQDWRSMASLAKIPAADIDIDLVLFLREAGEVRSAARVVEQALANRPPPGAEAVLRRQFAALLADLFERGRRRDPELLERAERETRHAYAITVNMVPQGRAAPTDPEIGALFNRLRSLAEPL